MLKFFFNNTKVGRKLLLKKLSPSVVSMTLKNEDHVLTFNPQEYIGKQLYLTGSWQRENLENVLKIIEEEGCLDKTKTIAVDLGANIGTHSVYLHLSKKFEKVLSIEADPSNAKLLSHNISQNNFENKTVLANCALVEKDGPVDFFINEKNQGGHSLNKRKKHTKKITVEGKELKTIFKDFNINSSNIGFIWVDLEGFEMEAFKQIVSVFSSKIPIFTEFSPLFYGEEKAREFYNLIQTEYSWCYIFDKNKTSGKVKTKEIPLDKKQIDVLLLPPKS